MTEGWLLTHGIETLFISLLLSTARPLAMIFILPIFTRFGLQQGLIQGGILVAFAAPVFPGMAEAYAAGPPLDTLDLALIIVKEMTIGAILALILGIPLWAVVAAGDIIDAQRGASMSTLVDPGSGDDTTITGTLFFLIAAVVLISSGWFTDVILASLYDSYVAWPILQPLPPLEPAAGAAVLGLLDALVEAGIVLAIPILAPLLLGEIALAIAGKYTQQINIMFLAMSMKQVVYIVMMPLYFGALIYYIRSNIRELDGSMTVLRGFLEPGVMP